VSDKVYLWRDLRFELPAGVVDDTLLAFKAPSAAFSLTVGRDLLGGQTLEAWARAQEQAMAAQKLAGYVGESPRSLEAPEGTKAVVVDRRFTDGAGLKLFQRQAFVAVGAAVVVVVTGAARDPATEQAKKAVVDVVATLRRSSGAT
jgi:hypothetical protein